MKKAPDLHSVVAALEKALPPVTPVYGPDSWSSGEEFGYIEAERYGNRKKVAHFYTNADRDYYFACSPENIRVLLDALAELQRN